MVWAQSAESQLSFLCFHVLVFCIALARTHTYVYSSRTHTHTHARTHAGSIISSFPAFLKRQEGGKNEDGEEAKGSSFVSRLLSGEVNSTCDSPCKFAQCRAATNCCWLTRQTKDTDGLVARRNNSIIPIVTSPAVIITTGADEKNFDEQTSREIPPKPVEKKGTNLTRK